MIDTCEHILRMILVRIYAKGIFCIIPADNIPFKLCIINCSTVCHRYDFTAGHIKLIACENISAGSNLSIRFSHIAGHPDCGRIQSYRITAYCIGQMHIRVRAGRCYGKGIIYSTIRFVIRRCLIDGKITF